MGKNIYDIGEIPELGQVPQKMHAQVIRAERFGEPKNSFQIEQVGVPELGPRDVLVYVMAAGINYNNVWAAMGVPVNVIAARNKAGEKEDFHIGGSDASGIVWAVGSAVKNVKVGDEVVAHCGWWDPEDPSVKAGKDPMFAPSQKIWGYETNWGSFAQFSKIQDHALLPKPKHLSWEEAACYMLVGATAYRMLHRWEENRVQKDDWVLIWGGAGGLGCMAIQIAKAAGAHPIAVVSSDSKIDYCKKLGAAGVINRNQFNHWGMLPHWQDGEAYKKWAEGARAFGKAIWEIADKGVSPRIVFEHPGEATVPTSIFVCDTGGMVVICAGTTGYNATMDLRYHWMRQKRFQGSHFANDKEAKGINDLVMEKKVDPCLSRVWTFQQTGDGHQLMKENRHPHGNMAILVNAKKEGLKNLEETKKAQ